MLKQRYWLNHKCNRFVWPDLWLLSANYSIKILFVVLSGDLLWNISFHPSFKKVKLSYPLRTFSKITGMLLRATSGTQTATSCQRKSTSIKLRLNMLLSKLSTACTKTSISMGGSWDTYYPNQRKMNYSVPLLLNWDF